MKKTFPPKLSEVVKYQGAFGGNDENGTVGINPFIKQELLRVVVWSHEVSEKRKEEEVENRMSMVNGEVKVEGRSRKDAAPFGQPSNIFGSCFRDSPHDSSTRRPP